MSFRVSRRLLQVSVNVEGSANDEQPMTTMLSTAVKRFDQLAQCALIPDPARNIAGGQPEFGCHTEPLRPDHRQAPVILWRTLSTSSSRRGTENRSHGREPQLAQGIAIHISLRDWQCFNVKHGSFTHRVEPDADRQYASYHFRFYQKMLL
jgi:hypothetical protein